MLFLHLPQIIVAWLAIVALVVSAMALVWTYAPRIDPSAIVSAGDAVSPVRSLGESERYMLVQLHLCGVRHARALARWETDTARVCGLPLSVLRAMRAAGATLARGPKGRMVSLRFSGMVQS